MKKKVSFSPHRQLFFIPKYDRDRDLLWWTPEDAINAKISMICDMKRLRSIHPNMTLKQIKHFLFEKKTITYDIRYFYTEEEIANMTPQPVALFH